MPCKICITYQRRSFAHNDVTLYPQCNAEYGAILFTVQTAFEGASSLNCVIAFFLLSSCKKSLSMSSDYISSLQASSLERYRKKLALCSLQDCVYRLPANVWDNDPTEWPPLEFGDIYVYLIETPGILFCL